MALKPKDAPDLGRFDWEDPFRLNDQLTEEERAIRDAARAYAQDKLQPRVIEAFRDEVTEGGFCQLIQNGYGAYIFGNPFARVMRLWGAESFSKLVYRAKKIYDANREDLERERTDEEFMAMYEQYEAFDELEEEFGEMEEEVTETLARYVDGHPELFATIVG